MCHVPYPSNQELPTGEELSTFITNLLKLLGYFSCGIIILCAFSIAMDFYWFFFTAHNLSKDSPISQLKFAFSSSLIELQDGVFGLACAMRLTSNPPTHTCTVGVSLCH